jgi:ribonuclease P protein component
MRVAQRVANDSPFNALKSGRIQALLKVPPKVNGAWAIYLDEQPVASSPQFAITVAKKFVRRAVDRNRLKRFARELVRGGAASAINSDCVIRLRRAVGTKTKGRLRKAESQSLKNQLVGLANERA